ncbi:MAG: ABC transporter substrate-binding protein [Pseudomonadota bacterium]
MPFSPSSQLKKYLVGSSLLLASLAPLGADAATAVKIGATMWVGYGPFFVAESKNFYKKHDLKVTLQIFSDPALIPTAMASASVDGGLLTYDQVIGTVAKGMAHKVVMPVDYSSGGDAIIATRAITKISDFKGKKIGFNPLSPSDFLLSYAMSKNGLTEKDIEVVPMSPEGVPAAMASDGIPIGVTYEPSLSQVLSQEGGKKFHVVFSSKNAPGLIADVLVFDDKYIKAHPKEIKGIMQAYTEALAYMKTHADESNKIIGKAMGVSAREAKEQLLGVYNIPVKEMPKAFMKSPDTTSYYTSGEVIGNILKNKGQISTIPPTESTLDDQFVKLLAK